MLLSFFVALQRVCHRDLFGSSFLPRPLWFVWPKCFDSLDGVQATKHKRRATRQCVVLLAGDFSGWSCCVSGGGGGEGGRVAVRVPCPSDPKKTPCSSGLEKCTRRGGKREEAKSARASDCFNMPVAPSSHTHMDIHPFTHAHTRMTNQSAQDNTVSCQVAFVR